MVAGSLLERRGCQWSLVAVVSVAFMSCLAIANLPDSKAVPATQCYKNTARNGFTETSSSVKISFSLLWLMLLFSLSGRWVGRGTRGRYDLFLIHTKEQKRVETASMFRTYTAKGFRCFVDLKMTIGHPRHQMEEALERCRHAVVILSPEFLNRKHPCAELQYAFERMLWLRSQQPPQWESLWVVLYNMSVDDYGRIRRKRKHLPPLDKELPLLEFFSEGGSGQFATWPDLEEELIRRIIEHDKDSAIKQWNGCVENWNIWCRRDFPRAHDIYEGSETGRLFGFT